MLMLFSWFITFYWVPAVFAFTCNSFLDKSSCIVLSAKRNKQQKSASPGRRGRRRDAISTTLEDDLTASHAATSTLARLSSPFKTRAVKLPIDVDSQTAVVVHEIVPNDTWWNDDQNDNPYGARLWPSALHVAQTLLQDDNLDLRDHCILEIGSGTGLVSIAAAAAGATVLATDISPTCLALVQAGWRDTLEQQQSTIVRGGSLTTQVFDICSNDPLPLVNHKPPTLIVAGAMLYDATLAAALARRVAQASCWVVIGEDDTGFRHNGRATFLKALDDCIKDDVMVQCTPSTTIACPQLGWKAKQVQIMHFNKPAID